MNSLCDTIVGATSLTWSCKETEHGARIRTTCVFPSFEPVFVYIVKFGDGFIVHDAGETMAIIMAHGQDGDLAKRVIRSECKRYDLEFGERGISLKIDAPEWLDTAIVSVANTAATAARTAISEPVKKHEAELADVLYAILEPKLMKGTLSKGFAYRGESGRRYRFDLAIQSKSGLTLIETVTSHAVSVNAKFVALSDVPTQDVFKKIVAHRGDLSSEEILLLQNVATVASPEGVVELVASRQPYH